MSVMDLLAARRTYRRFAQKAIPQDVVNDIVEALRLSSCGANRQAVRLVIVQKPEDVAQVQPLVKWAAYLPPEQGMPKADELPTLYVAVVQDTTIPGDQDTDAGIALANMTLAAWDKGVGSCIMGAIDRPRLTELLGLAETEKLHTMIAFGYPTHAAHVVPMTAQTGVKYYLDDSRDYCVPKRSTDELARTL
ncbi:MAG: nitroreductase family protein [Faecalibacterium sp.]